MNEDSPSPDGPPAEHVPVLTSEVMRWLAVKADGTYVDCTVGLAGHATLIASRLRGGRLIALDRDPASVAIAQRRLSDSTAAAFTVFERGRVAPELR